MVLSKSMSRVWNRGRMAAVGVLISPMMRAETGALPCLGSFDGEMPPSSARKRFPARTSVAAAGGARPRRSGRERGDGARREVRYPIHGPRSSRRAGPVYGPSPIRSVTRRWIDQWGSGRGLESLPGRGRFRGRPRAIQGAPQDALDRRMRLLSVRRSRPSAAAAEETLRLGLEVGPQGDPQVVPVPAAFERRQVEPAQGCDREVVAERSRQAG